MATSTLRLPSRDSIAEINITPLIDVMLSLLVIFMITAPIVTSSIKMPLAGGEPAPQAAPLELSISGDGQVSRHGMALSTLEWKAELYAYAAQPGSRALQIHPSPDTQHQRLIEVMDQAQASGITSISLDNVAAR